MGIGNKFKKSLVEDISAIFQNHPARPSVTILTFQKSRGEAKIQRVLFFFNGFRNNDLVLECLWQWHHRFEAQSPDQTCQSKPRQKPNPEVGFSAIRVAQINQIAAKLNACYLQKSLAIAGNPPQSKGQISLSAFISNQFLILSEDRFLISPPNFDIWRYLSCAFYKLSCVIGNVHSCKIISVPFRSTRF